MSDPTSPLQPTDGLPDGLPATDTLVALERITTLVARMLAAPMVFVTLIEGDRLHVWNSRTGSESRVLPLSQSVGQTVVAARAPVRMHDARANPAIGEYAESLGVVAYLGVPMLTHEGEVLGTVSACDDHPRDWTDAEEEILVGLAAALTAELSLHREMRRREEAAKEQRELETRLQHAQKLQSLGRFAGTIAHDFNNLLMVVGGNLDFVRQRLAAASLSVEEVDEIDVALRRAGEMTRQLLTFGRKPRPVTQAVDVAALLPQLAAVARRVVGSRIVIDLEVGDQPVPALVEPGQLEQAVLNLVANARDAMPGGGTITLCVRVLDVAPESPRARAGLAPGRWAAVSVRDEGTGMDEATRARIFEPFFTTKPASQGTGFGLPSVYAVAHQAGGMVEVETALGSGSTFTLLLPHGGDRAPVAAANDDQEAGEAASEPAPAARRATVLLVEDEPRVRLTVHRMLERLGYDVVEARHGREALELVSQGHAHVDVVLTDVVMPEMGASVLVERLRVEHPSLPVILMSGYSEQAVRGQDFAGHGLDVLEKPFEPAALAARLRAALASREADARSAAR